MNFTCFRRKFDEILPEFHRDGQEMTKCPEILRKIARKMWKMLEISGICEKFHFSFHFSFVSLPKTQDGPLGKLGLRAHPEDAESVSRRYSFGLRLPIGYGCETSFAG